MIPPIARRFVAGETVSDALGYATEQNEDGLSVILNLLGEHYDDPAAAAADRDTYLQLIREIDERGLDGCISVKPTQLGLDLGVSNFRENLEPIVDEARSRDVFVWIDMEDHQTTDATIDTFESFAKAYPDGMGVCLQANLKRTPDDLERLSDIPGKLRLVKGAYNEPAEVAYRSKSAINEAYRDLIDQAFTQCDDGIAVASHDDTMIEFAQRRHEETGTPFEIQMLMGVRADYQRELAAEYEVYHYIPFGDRWLSYFYRRLMERKENLLFGLRAVIGR